MKFLLLFAMILGFGLVTFDVAHGADLPRRHFRMPPPEVYVGARRLPPSVLWSPDLNDECSLPSESCQSSRDCCNGLACVAGYCGGPNARMIPPRVHSVPACETCETSCPSGYDTCDSDEE